MGRCGTQAWPRSLVSNRRAELFPPSHSSAALSKRAAAKLCRRARRQLVVKVRQELAVVVAPKLLGGHASRTPLGDLDLINLDQAKQLALKQTISLGDDLLLVGLLS